ncbi:MAG: YraN family protein [Candidatus Cloacimonetes bacterium]|nr:YraN family protein [Candidatus Cloacimonadota bacterium]
MNTKQTGKLGEDIACDYLKKNGYKILQKNFEIKVSRFLKSEIDIIAKKNETIHFIEVKTLKQKGREQFSAFLPEDRVDFKKKQKLIKTAQIWLTKHKLPLQGTKWQIDIISVSILVQDGDGLYLYPVRDGAGRVDSDPKISHFENVVSQCRYF